MELFETTSDVGEELKRCKEETAESGGGGDRSYYKIEEGEAANNKVRILPPLKGQKTPWYHVKLHFGIITSEGKNSVVLCGKQNFDDCPFCREAALLREAGDKMKSWNAMAKDQYMYNVVDADGNVFLLSADKKLQAKIISQVEFAVSDDGAEAGQGDYPWDIEKGCWLKIVKTKGQKSGKQKYPPNIWNVHLLAKKPLEEDKRVNLESVSDLTKIYKEFNPDDLQLILDGKMDPYPKDDEEKEEKTGTASETAGAEEVPENEVAEGSDDEAIDQSKLDSTLKGIEDKYKK